MKKFLVVLAVAAFSSAQGPAFAQDKKSEPTQEESKKVAADRDASKKAAADPGAAKKTEDGAKKDGKKKVKKGGC